MNQQIRKIAIIDDDDDEHYIFEDAIKDIDSSIEICHLSSAKNVPAINNQTLPDIVFLDINMPDRNGFEWLKLIREKGYCFPVVMYSTANNSAYVQKAFREGADLYFPKPDSVKKLKESLYKLFQLNWNEPEEIKAEFCRDGHYKTFPD